VHVDEGTLARMFGMNAAQQFGVTLKQAVAQ
jgi:hypothetical protein